MRRESRTRFFVYEETIRFDKDVDFCQLAITMDQLEIELKFYVPDERDLRDRLMQIGAACINQKTFEHNVRYETEDGRLQKNRCLLRLRQDRHTTLTFKSPPHAADTRFKVYHEREVRLDDFDTMDAILGALGFGRRQVYQKWRETWRLDEVELCVDTMPYGSFLEIEGSPDTIMQAVRDLGLGWGRRILASYLEMFAVLHKKEGLPFTDVTFDNFSTVNVSFAAYRHLFETGAAADP